jgi:uncharacterized membrane protein
MATSTAPPPIAARASHAGLRRPRSAGLRALPSTALAFGGLVAAMFASLLLAAAALGMYEAVLIAELAALGILALTYALWRHGPGPSTDAQLRARRDRERRGF